MTRVYTTAAHLAEEHQRSGTDWPVLSADSTIGQAPRTPLDFLSEAQCRELVARLVRYADGIGYTAATIWSAWSGHVRWARNQISTSGEVRNTFIRINRDLKGANYAGVLLNELSDVALVAAARQAERLSKMAPQQEQWELVRWYGVESMSTPHLYSETTAAFGTAARADTAIALAKQAADAGVLSAGYIEVSAHSLAMLDTAGHVRYVPYTAASYDVTVRDPKGHGSGWAGVDWPDWNKIDAPTLSQTALDKCLQSRNPVAIEPGRYMTILEPQAVCDFVGQLVYGALSECLEKELTLFYPTYPFFESRPSSTDPGRTKLGERIVDERITISADPMDPELGFPPFIPNASPFGGNWLNDWFGADVYHPTTWIKDGVLTALEYHQARSGWQTGDGHPGLGAPNSGAFRMSGGPTSIDEMIATTKRGLLVTRFDRVQTLDLKSLLLRGYTRDGLWLVENGKISRPVKNFMFVESILSALNNVEQLGVPQRVYHPQTGWVAIPQPVIVPPLKIKDFSFPALCDAV